MYFMNHKTTWGLATTQQRSHQDTHPIVNDLTTYFQQIPFEQNYL